MYTCANCGRPIPTDEVAEPCPACRSLDRSVTVAPDTVRARAEIPTPVVVTTSSHAIDALIVAAPEMRDVPVPSWTRDVADLGYKLLWFRPTDANPYWYVRIETMGGRGVDVALADSPQAALADVLLRLLPPETDKGPVS